MTTLALHPSPALLRLSDAALLLVALVWGTSYGVAKGALLLYPVIGFIAIRFGLTFVLLLPSLLRASSRQRRHALRNGLPLGLLLLGIFLAETYGVAQTQASNAAFLISLCVVFTPFAEWWLLRRRPNQQAFVFVGISLLGTLLLSGGVNLQFGLGDGLMLVAAVLRALIMVMTSRYARERPAPALALTAVQAAVVSIGCLAIAAFTPAELPALPSAPSFWLSTLYLVLGCTIFAFYAQNWALRYSSPTRVALLTGAEPAFGALFAIFWLGEHLTPTAWLGGALIVAAALWASSRRH